ncbi:MAG TPA: DUF1080 domain-containing protein [Bryobacteraceae bacterium]|nr:DUF1080 domain-containing protein [Bryobacteraceae bacterium]
MRFAAWKVLIGVSLLAAPIAFYAQGPGGALGGSGRGGRGGRGGGISVVAPPMADFNDHTGFVQIFDGTSLKGWDGDPNVWKVEDGAIVGHSPAEKPVGTTFIIWRGGEPGDFDLKAEVKAEGSGANTGIQYRSRNEVPTFGRGGPGGGARGGSGGAGRAGGRGTPPDPRWQVAGYQADFDFVNRYSGQLMDSSNARFILTPRGTVVVSEEGQPAKTLAYLGNYAELAGYVKINDWNQYEVIAKGNTLTHIINGHVMSITIDNDTKLRALKGLIALQIEGNGGVTISYRNLWLKTLN